MTKKFTFVATVPALHTVRSASGSFFFIGVANKDSLSVTEQIALLKSRGMLFRQENQASHFLSNISYYRLKGYWWDMQTDNRSHTFNRNSYFEDVLDRYTFDRHLRLILFDAIERIEIGLRTKMIYHLSQAYGGLWYLDANIAHDKSIHTKLVSDLKEEFARSQEIFAKDHRARNAHQEPDAWLILEVASLGTLSKIYKNIGHQLPEKSKICKEMGLNLHSELSSWLEAITVVRNIIAHHSRLWNRNMVRTPMQITNASGIWLTHTLLPVQIKKPYLVISALIYLCNHVSPHHQIKQKLLDLFAANPGIPIYKMGFLNNWKNENFWA